jgi:hypothetical protein
LWKVTKKTGSGDGGTERNYEGLENACPPTFNPLNPELNPIC